MKPIDNYRRMIVALETDQPMPADVSQWLKNGFGYFVNGDAKSLCQALGLRGAGIRKIQNIELMRHRDILLRLSLGVCAKSHGESLWSKCETLADQINRFPRSRQENPLLQPLFDLNAPLPRSAGGIYDRIKLVESWGYSPRNRKGK